MINVFIALSLFSAVVSFALANFVDPNAAQVADWLIREQAA